MLSSCENIGTIGGTTLSGATLSGTLGVDTLIGTLRGASLGNTSVWVFYGHMFLNNIANLLMACNWLSPIMKGFLGPAFSILVPVPWLNWWLALLLIILEC